jgi:hypothetical protein
LFLFLFGASSPVDTMLSVLVPITEMNFCFYSLYMLVEVGMDSVVVVAHY